MIHESAPLKPKVLLIGFDGATWNTFRASLNQGLMPNLAGLIRNGVKAPLKTIRPTLSPVIWTSIATGKLPEKHGVKAIVDIHENTGRMFPLTSKKVKTKRIWQILSEKNIDVLCHSMARYLAGPRK